MVLAETPEKKATEKLAPVILERLPRRISGRARLASFSVQLRLSIKLAINNPMLIKQVILAMGRTNWYKMLWSMVESIQLTQIDVEVYTEQPKQNGELRGVQFWAILHWETKNANMISQVWLETKWYLTEYSKLFEPAENAWVLNRKPKGCRR